MLVRSTASAVPGFHDSSTAEDWDALENAPVGLVSFMVGIQAMMKIDHNGKIKKNRKGLV